MEKGISIIIPCYNAGKFLKLAITSILSQPFKYPFELLVIDDCSDDLETKRILAELSCIEKVKFYEMPINMGVQYCRNIGVQSSSFEYIPVMDSDDCLNTNKKLLRSGTYTDRAIEILSYSDDIAFVQTTTQMIGNYYGLTISAYPITEPLILEKHHVSTWIVYRRTEAIESGLYNLEIKKWQDWSFAVGLLNFRFLNGKKNGISFFKEPYYLYRIHNKTKRISETIIDEKLMIKLTLERHPNIFRFYYPNYTDEQIIDIVYKKKPSKLYDLLHIASYDLKRAIEIIKKREYELFSPSEPKNIP